jgi:hypothetical protein
LRSGASIPYIQEVSNLVIREESYIVEERNLRF